VLLRYKWQAAFLRSVFVSTTHCASGCVAGDVIGAPIVFAAGWTIFGEPLYAEYVALFSLAYSLGIAFQYFPIRAARKITRRSALAEAIKADTLALTAFEAGPFAWMGAVYFFVMPRPELASPFYWFMMQIGMVIGSLPVCGELVSCPIGCKARHVVARVSD
jgi:hypothetical protein